MATWSSDVVNPFKPPGILPFLMCVCSPNWLALHPGSHDIVKWCRFLFYKNTLIGYECFLLIPRNVETVHVFISCIIKAVQVYTSTMFLSVC